MTPLLWLVFVVLVGALVVLDLGLLSRRPRIVRPVDAVSSLGLWALAAVAFSLVVAYVYQHNPYRLEEQLSAPLAEQPALVDLGPSTGSAPAPGNEPPPPPPPAATPTPAHPAHAQPGPAARPADISGPDAWWQFVTCYVLELALSLDNLAVLALVYAAFGLPRELLPRALFWSMLASLGVRLGLIMGGAALFRRHPAELTWAFGAVLVAAMARTLLLPGERSDLSHRWYVRLARAVARPAPHHDGQPHRTRAPDASGRPRLAATPMLAAALAGGLLDVTFAADSVPALFSVTRDPFLAFSASAFAVLGLRSLYLALAGVFGRFRYLRVALVFILLVVAAKMLTAPYRPWPPALTLAAVAGAVVLGVGASVLWNRRYLAAHPELAPRPSPLEDLTDAVAATRRNLRKVLILIAGTAIILFGVAIAPLPGPGPTILVPIGLGLLATEFVWAKRLMDSLKSGAFNISDRLDAFCDRRGRWAMPALVVAAFAAIYAVFRLVLAVVRVFRPETDPGFWTLAVALGSPATPILLWAVNHARQRGKRLAAARTPRPDARPPAHEAAPPGEHRRAG